MADTVSSHGVILKALAERGPRKSHFRPGLGQQEAFVYELIAQRINRFRHTLSVPQVAEYFGCTRQAAFQIIWQLIRKGWLKTQSVRPSEPWRVDKWRGRYVPTLEASAFEHLHELVEIALSASELRERPTVKLDMRALQRKAETVLDKIAGRAARPTYINFNKSWKGRL